MSLPRSSCRAFTLVEMALSLLVLTIILSGVVSSLALSARAVESSSGQQFKHAQSAAVLAHLAEDLSLATSVSTLTPTSCTFEVPDRNDDGQRETLSLSWGGDDTDPILLALNEQAPEVLLSTASAFMLTPRSLEIKELIADSLSESASLVLSQCASSGSAFYVGNGSWIGLYLLPDLPPNAVSWCITGVQVQARRRGGSGGTLLVQVRSASAGELPTTSVLDQATVYESALSALLYAPHSVSLSAVPLTPETPVCITFVNPNTDYAADLAFAPTGVLQPGAHLVHTTASESGWSATGYAGMTMTVYGRYTVTSEQTTTTERLIAVDVSLSTEHMGSQTRRVTLFNSPEMPK